jgi:branched-chain amino acid transport system ATP-binding protein
MSAPTHTQPLLAVRGLTLGYDRTDAVKGIDFDVGHGAVVTLIGANGAGKSTFLKSIAGQMPNKSGQIRFNSEEIGHLPSDRIVRDGISMVPEGRRLFRSLTVEENLKVGAFAGRKGRWTLDAIYSLFPVLKDKRNNPATALSGGQQQMVAIGRGLMSNPDLLMCDEVSLGLSPAVVKDIYNAFPSIRSEGLSLIVVEQDIDAALRIADTICCFMHGRITLRGAPAELTRDRISAAYFGIEDAR